MLARIAFAVLACSSCASVPRTSPPATAQAAVAPAHRPLAFWKALIADGYRIPPEEDVAELLHDLRAMLASTEPEVRDDVPYDVTTHWLFPERAIDDEHLRAHAIRLREQMLRDVERSTPQGDESVLGRSFAALHLSLLAASDVKNPFLSDDDWRGLLHDALRYLASERDVRGFVAGTGWHHSVAHGADLLKFLARSPHLRRDEQTTVLAAIGSKLDALPDVLAWGEDDRLAQVLLSIVRRGDFDAQGFESWVRETAVRRDAAWKETPLDPAKLVAAQNRVHVLRAAYVRLQAAARPSDAESAAATQVLEALKASM